MWHPVQSVQTVGAICSGISAVAGATMAFTLFHGLRTHTSSPSMKICHALLIVTGFSDVLYCFSVLLRQPFHSDSPGLCSLQGVLIDLTLLIDAMAFACLAVEIYITHKWALKLVAENREERHTKMRCRGIVYSTVVLAVPLSVIVLNQLTAQYGTSTNPDGRFNSVVGTCWLKNPTEMNEVWGFFVWIWLAALVSMGMNGATAYNLRSSSVLRANTNDNDGVRKAKERARVNVTHFFTCRIHRLTSRCFCVCSCFCFVLFVFLLAGCLSCGREKRVP